ncbi:hypothetical protein OGAPHI_001227 [Ogataea philodendri]|uniref:HRDC domain-containing protein n=1 Tax=Ogataea philodendri TaxID=1378263 RepID=A0A9P8PEU1_9ASCO|nr:uncharacterized protein OGAPHI_001227 [Ogataea philodendri]KAH3670712.1 hypothetical protein OGAPHI_001227 [Ogataea philodendri]
MGFSLDSLAPSLINLIRLSSAVNSKDIGFYNSIDPTVKTNSDEVNQRLIDLLNETISNAVSISTDQTDQLTVDDESKNWKVVSGILDTLFENAEIALDQNQKKTQASAVKDEFTYLDESDTAGTRKASPQPRNIAKPQLLFKTPVDNFETSPFKPLITTKPNALISFNESMELVPAVPDTPEHYNNPYTYEIMNQEYPDWIFRTLEPFDSIPWKESEEPTWIDKPEQLDELLVELAKCKVIAVDLEHHDYRTYHGITSLMQLTTDTKKDYLIDPLSPDLRPHLVNLNIIFTDPNILKVFHGAFMDIIWLQRDLGLYVVSLFDTYHASRELGLGRHSLAHLLETYVKFKTSKKWQLADWRVRPLNTEMKNYAKADTHFLIEVFHKMHSELVKDQDKLKRVLYESRKVSNRRYEYSTFRPKRIKSSNGFPSGADVVATNQSVPQLPEFKEQMLFASTNVDLPWTNMVNSNSIPMAKRPLLEVLFKWRDEQARKEDESPRFIMSDFMLISLVNAFDNESQEVTEQTVLSVINSSSRFGSSQFVRTRLRELAELIQGCLDKLKELDTAMWDSVYETTDIKDVKGLEEAFEIIKNDFAAQNEASDNGVVVPRSSADGAASVQYTNKGVKVVNPDEIRNRFQKVMDYFKEEDNVEVEIDEEDGEESEVEETASPEPVAAEPEPVSTDDLITLRKHQPRKRKQQTVESEKLDTSQKIMVNKPQQPRKRKTFEPNNIISLTQLGGLLQRLGLATQQGERWCRKLVSSFKEVEFHDEREFQDFSLTFLNEFSSGLGRASGGQDVVDDDDVGSLRDGLGLDLEKVLAVLFGECCRVQLTRQLSLLSNRNKACIDCQRKRWAEQEPSGLQSHDVVYGLVWERGLQVQLERSDEFVEQRRVSKDRQEVFEQNALGGEVRVLVEREFELGSDFLQLIRHEEKN